MNRQSEKMTGRQRVLAALRRQPVDRTPVCNPTSVATFGVMDGIGASFEGACRDPQHMARVAAAGHAELGFDSVMPVFSVVQESSALGCRVRWEERSWPSVDMSQPLWTSPDQIRIPADFLEHPDTRCVLEAIARLRKVLGLEVAIIGKAMGPWSLSYHCFGLEPFLIMSLEEPETTKACLERLKEVTVQFGLAQIEAGADVLCVPDHATGELVSPRFYRRYLLEVHAELARRIPAPIILHICGRTLDRMEHIAETGVAGFHFDSKNDPRAAMDIIRGRLALVGNVNNPETLLRQGPAEVRRDVYRALEAGIPLIAPECAVPLQTPSRNLREIPLAVGEWHEERRTPQCH